MRLRTIALLVAIAAIIVACASQRTTAQTAPWLCVSVNGSFSGCPTPTPGPLGPLNVSPTSLSFVAAGAANAKQITISETNYTGNFTYTPTGCSGIVTFSASSGVGPGAVALIVTPVANGTCSTAITDNHSGSVTVNITVNIPAPTPGPLSVSPSSLTFANVGALYAQSLSATESNYLSTLMLSGCGSNASLSPSSFSGPSGSSSITPTTVGSCTINVADNHGGSVNVPVTITTPTPPTPAPTFGPLTVSPSSLSFTALGSANAQTLSVSETNYSNSFTITNPCSSSVVTVGSLSFSGPSGSSSVTPQGNGSCTLNVSDNHGGSVNVSVSVATPSPSPGPLTVSPSSLSFSTVGNGGAQTLALSESNYSGTISVTLPSSCNSIISSNVTGVTGPNGSAIITPLGNGSCTAQITDNHSGSVNVTATVNASVPITVSPTSLTFTNVGATLAQTLSISETTYAGSYTLSGCATSIVTVVPTTTVAGASATTTVTPVGSGSCTLAIHDSGTSTQNVPVTVTTPTPPPATVVPPIVQTYSLANTGTANTITVAPAVTPSPGDMELVTVVTYNVAGNNYAVSGPSGWTNHDACWDGLRNGVYTFYHLVSGTETMPYVFSLPTGNTSYMSAMGYDLSGTTTPNPFEQSLCKGFSSTAAPSTGSLTPQQANDLEIAQSTTEYGSSPTDATGWTSDADVNHSANLHSAHQGNPVGSSSDTFTYSGSLASGNTINMLIAPVVNASPTPQPVPPFTPLIVYAHQANSLCGSGWNGFDLQAAQDVTMGAETCAIDTGEANLVADYPSGGNGRLYLYWNATQVDCNTSSVTNEWNYLYTNPGTSDEAFLHTGSPPSTSNRLTSTGTSGKCDTTGGSTGSLSYYPNMAKPEVAAWEVANLMSSTTFSSGGYLAGSTWNCIRWDNESFRPAYSSAEFGWNVQKWRQSLGTHTNNTAPWCTAANSEGPGTKVYAHNQLSLNGDPTSSGGNGAGNGIGVYKWAIDDEDWCDAMNAAAKAKFVYMLAEKSISSQQTLNKVTSIDLFPQNLKVLVNTASHHWADANCSNIYMAFSGMTGQNGTTSWIARAYGTMFRALTEPTNFGGNRGVAGSLLALRFGSTISQWNSMVVFPEDELVFANPIQPLSLWSCSTATGGSCASTSDALGNGCYADTGGINNFAQLCGSIGTDANGGTAPVYVREFKHCYQLGVDLGGCAVVGNLSTSANITLSQLKLSANYTQMLTPSGRELYVDPVTPGHYLCASGTTCDGQWATTAITSSTVIPHGTWGGSANSAYLDSMNQPAAPSGAVNNSPFAILLKPTVNSAYTYYGCNVYPANDWFTTNLVTGGSSYAVNTVDPNSTNIINNLSSVYGSINWYSPTQETVNLAPSTTPMQTVNGATMYDPLGLDTSNLYPVTNPEYEEGAASGGCSGDCHDITLRTDTCVDYEVYKSGSRNWSGTTFTTQNGEVHGLNTPFNNQYSGDGNRLTAAGIPLMGTTAWGEDVNYQVASCQPNCAIPHALGMVMPQAGNAIGGNYVNPATASELACSTNCTNKAYYGMRLRLKSSFTCPSVSTHPQANLICNTLKQYGAIVVDTAGSGSCTPNTTGAGACVYGLRFGTNSNSSGSNPWSGDGCCGSTPSGDLGVLLQTGGANYLNINNFEVMTLGTIH